MRKNVIFASGNGKVSCFYFECSVILINFFRFQSGDSSNLFKLIGTASQLVWGFVLIFIFCDLCEKLSTAFDDIWDVTGQLEWYLYPSEMKRSLLFIIMNAQQEIVVECYGSISCGLETFKNVSNY